MENRAVKKVIVVYEDGSEEVLRREEPGNRQERPLVPGNPPEWTGEKLKALRKSYGMSQVEFGRYLGVTGTYISNMENGKQAVSPRICLMLVSKASRDSPITSEEVKQLRKQMGLNQKEFAEFFHVNQATVSAWEHGTRQLTPKTSFFLRLVFEKIVQDQGGT